MTISKDNVRLEGTKMYINNEVVDLRAQQADAIAKAVRRGYDGFAKLVQEHAKKWLGNVAVSKDSEALEASEQKDSKLGAGLLGKVQEKRSQEDDLESNAPSISWSASSR